MKNGLKIFSLVLLITGIFTFPILAEVDVQIAETIPFDLGTNIIDKVGGFFVIDDQLVIITDEWAGNIRVLKRNGGKIRSIRIIGQQGYGPDEFLSPYNCSFDKESSRFVAADWQREKIFLYHYYPDYIDFKRDIVEIPCPRGVFDLLLKGDMLFVAGHHKTEDGQRYGLYSIHLGELSGTNNGNQMKPRSLVSAKEMYQFEDSPDFKTQYSKKFIPIIGMNYSFDIHNSDAYIVWMGDLKILKLGTTSKREGRRVFGKKTRNYVKPHPSKRLVDAYLSGDRDLYLEELKKMSLVWKVFTTSNHVLLIYEGPFKFNEDDKSNFWLQFYTMDGKFKGEKQLDGRPSRRLYFDKDNHILYSISGDLEGGILSLLKYRIIE
jgi:hypothetical protein